MILVECAHCGKKTPKFPFELRNYKQSFCSRLCSSKRIVTEEAKEKMRKAKLGRKEELGSHWLGDEVGYFGLHDWIERVAGRPKKCENCGTDKRRMYHWANIGHTYNRRREEWIRLCVSCHRLLDNGKITIVIGKGARSPAI